MSNHMFDAVREAAAERAATFIETTGGRVWTYGDMLDLSGRLAGRLVALGVEPGDRVAVQVEKSPEALLYPKEVESEIDQLSGVVESAVIGMPHPDFGEGVTAVIVNTMGKVQKNVLRDRYKDIYRRRPRLLGKSSGSGDSFPPDRTAEPSYVAAGARIWRGRKHVCQVHLAGGPRERCLTIVVPLHQQADQRAEGRKHGFDYFSTPVS